MGTSPQAKSKSTAAGEEFRATSRLKGPFGKGGGGLKLRDGEVRTVNKAASVSQALQFATLAFGGSEHLTRPYEEDPILHAALRMRANAFRQLPLRFYDKDPLEHSDAKTVDSGPVVELFQAPNHQMTSSSFFEAGIIHRALTGEDFWILYDENGKAIQPDGSRKIPLPFQMYPVGGDCVTHRLGENGWVDQWRVGLGNGGNLTVAPGSLIQFADYDPANPQRGIGAIQALIRSLELGYQAERYQEAVMRNSGDPGGTITIEEEMPHTEEKAAERDANEQWGPENRGRVRVVSGKGIKYEANKLGPKEMEFLELRKWNRGLVAIGLGIPLPQLGDTSASTYSNVEQAAEDFWKGPVGLLAYKASVEDVINSHFLPRIKDDRVSGLVARFDTSRVEALQEDHTTKLKAAHELVKNVPGMTWNEAVSLVGLDVDPIEQGDHRFVAVNLQPIDKALAEDEEPEPDPESPPDPPDVPDEEPEEDPEEDPDASKSLTPETREAEVTAAEAGRVAYWKSFEDRVLEPGEKDIAKRYRGWSRRYEKAQIRRVESFAKNGQKHLRLAHVLKDDIHIESASLTEEDLAFLNLNAQEWEKRMSGDLGPGIDLVFDRAAADMAEELGGIAIPNTDPRVAQFLATQKMKLVEGHNSYLAGRIRSSMLGVLHKANSTGTLQDLVRESLPELTEDLRRVFGTRDARALTIARTETAHASNGARFLEMKEEGLAEHEWVTSGDAAVRGHPSDESTQYSHYELDGKTALVGEVFARSLRHPSDPQAAAGDVINCRCITRPVVPPKE